MNEPTPTGERVAFGYLVLVTLVAAIGGFLFGFDLSIISGAILFLKDEWSLTPFWMGAVTGSAILGCPFGAFLGVFLSDRWGRNRSLILSAFLFFISAVGSALPFGPIDFSFWRFVGGIGVGLASTVSPMYIAEISPARLRGMMVILNQLAIVVGLTLSVYVSYVLSFGGHWRWMFASEALPSVALGVALFFVPLSPRWLAMRGRRDEALAVLATINGPAQARAELDSITAELGEEHGGWRELLQAGVRRATIIGIVLMVFSQINGVNMILIYTPTLFMEAGVTNAPDAILNSVYVTSWITACTIVSFWLTSRFGRRPILIIGPIGMALGELTMFCKFAYTLPPWATLTGMFLATGAFTLTLAPLSWVVLSEMFPNRVRGVAMSLATTAMFTSSYIVTNLFPFLLAEFKRAFGHPGGTFIIFACICVACSIFVWRLLPETKDKTLEEIGRHWLRYAPADSPARQPSALSR
ncbi:MAG: sugar porter family MFS transporter [Alphaproteobacteria bacterium]|nr:sugar porter family MFS transporter [Alphaproteobacteria bacterium]